MFLSVEEELRTYLVQDTISSEVLLIPQVSLTENQARSKYGAKRPKVKKINLSRSEIYAAS